MRQFMTTAAVLALLAGAPALALAQPAGPEGGQMSGSSNMGPNGQPGAFLGERQPMAAPYRGYGREREMRGRANEQDRRFVAEATSAGLAEVAAGHLALNRAAEPAVAEFGRWMITDHTELGDTLRHDAERAGILVPQGMAGKQREMLDRLRRYNGAEFDMNYINDQIEAHEQALGLFQREAQYGGNPLLRWFAHHSHWILEQHLAEAQALRSTPQASTARAAHMAGAPMAPMPNARRASPGLQAGTSPALRHELNKEGAKKIEKASP
jgi:putative membrane protein